MSTVAEVVLWGTRVGQVAIEDGQPCAAFEYDRAFLRSGIEVSPLSMPLSGQVYRFASLPQESFHGLPGMLADSLPDRFGNALIDAWLVQQGRTPGSLNPVERLCYTGTRGMGALEYRPVLGPVPDARELIEFDALVELATRVLSQREGLHVGAGEGAMRQVLQVGTSAGGARAKAVVAFNETTGEVRSGQVEAGDGFEHWLVKFDGVRGNRDHEDEDAPRYTRIEYAYFLMARAAGLQMSECRLFEEGPRAHFMTRRFDRVGTEKLHMQTLAALAHADFNAPGAFSYERAAQVVRMLGLGQEELEQLYLRMAFNILAHNNDDHVKNISFLMDKQGRWSLAPAYDVTYAYKPAGLWTGSHQMTVNGKRDGFGSDDLLAAARAMDIRAGQARELLQLVRHAVARWPEFATAAGVSEAVAARLQASFPGVK